MDFTSILVLAVVVMGLMVLIHACVKPSNPSRVVAVAIEYARSLFPALLLVVVIRSFVVQIYHVPSGSLEPTILPGDFIVVSQFAYGLRLPVFHTKILELGQPQRGDIVLFYWPVDPRSIFIKRLIGLPGDRIRYENKVLYINNIRAKQYFISQDYDTEPHQKMVLVSRYREHLGDVVHDIFSRPDYNESGDFSTVVPSGYYFMMGDNRDDSGDSRIWGFVPEKNLIGKAQFILFSWDRHHHRLRWHRSGQRLK